MDRWKLIHWSLEVDDETFLSAFAALGALCALRPSTLAATHGATGWRADRIYSALKTAMMADAGILKWQPPAIRMRDLIPQIWVADSTTRRPKSICAPDATQMASVWQKLRMAPDLNQAHEVLAPRMAVLNPPGSREHVMALMSLLTRPELGASSVCIDAQFPGTGQPRWRRPFTIATVAGDILASHFLAAAKRMPAGNPFRFVIANSDVPHVEVLVVGLALREALVNVLSSDLPISCSLLIVAGLGDESPTSAEPLLRALAARVSAQGVAVVVAGRSATEFFQQVQGFAGLIAQHQSMDMALTQAFLPGGLLLLNRSLQKLHDAEGPVLGRVASALAARDHVSDQAHLSSVPRFVQQRTYRKRAGKISLHRGSYVVGLPLMVQVFIGPVRRDTVSADTAFPEGQLPQDAESHTLRLVFHEPHQFDQPMQSDIVLPASGDSTTARFVFTPRMAGAFEGRISVLHRGRVLQTVLLRTCVLGVAEKAAGKYPFVTLAVEAQVRHDWSDLGQRRQFDMAMVLNHTSSGQPALTGVTGQRAWATSLQGIEQPVRKINELISAVAHSVADYGDGLDQGENPALLVQLARVGANLYSLLYRDQLKLLSSEGFDAGAESVTFLQVISARPDAVVPLEFMYDFNAPNPDATVCPQHRDALRQGRCPAQCHRSLQPRAYVCPMGFWGLKKVIERHLFDPHAVVPVGAEVTVMVEPLAGRERLDLKSGAMVAHSQEVAAVRLDGLLKTLSGKSRRKVPVVKNWGDWLRTVKTRHPALLMAFPHNEGKEENVLLEIGGDKLYTLDLPTDYVLPANGSPPIVFLLGCDVAGTAQDYASHIRYFRQAGAAVVVSTIATVFGDHAVRVGQAMAAGLLAASPATDALRMGEVIRDAKRAALLDSVPMALCVVAFGDADWRL